MNRNEKPKIDEVLARLWEVSGRIVKDRGGNIGQLLKDWTQKQSDKLSSPGARTDFDELCTDGCLPQVLAVLLTLLRFSPSLEQLWGRVYGSNKERRKTRQALLESAAALEQLLSLSITLENEKVATRLAEMGHLSPSRLVSELRDYAFFLNLVDLLPRETGIRSLSDFLKFALSDYVKLTTGRFRDRNVSALVGEILGPADYNEVAHRMWRHRNYSRMQKSYAPVSDLLQRVGQVVVILP